MSSPFDGLLIALTNDESCDLIALGDSTAYGMISSDWATKYGWAGRIGISLGDRFDVNVVIRVFQKWRGNGTSGSGNAKGPATFATALTIRETERAGAATLTVWLAGWPGGVASDYVTYASQMLPVSDPKLVMLYSGYNESTTTSYVDGTRSVITAIKTLCTGAPIVVCDQHITTIAGAQFRYVYFSQLFTALVGLLLPGAAYGTVNPPLQASTTIDGVWLLDTQQASVGSAQLNTDGLHPTSAGYDVIAAWMLDRFTAVVTGNPPTIATTKLAELTTAVAISQTLEASGTAPISWSIQSGSLPAGLAINSSTGVVSGTPTGQGDSYDVTIRATNSYGYDQRRYTGTIYFTPLQPFVLTGEARTKVKLAGLYYLIPSLIKASGAFKGLRTVD